MRSLGTEKADVRDSTFDTLKHVCLDLRSRRVEVTPQNDQLGTVTAALLRANLRSLDQCAAISEAKLTARSKEKAEL